MNIVRVVEQKGILQSLMRLMKMDIVTVTVHGGEINMVFAYKMTRKLLAVVVVMFSVSSCVNQTGIGGSSNSGRGGDGISGNTEIDQKTDVDADLSPLP